MNALKRYLSLSYQTSSLNEFVKEARKNDVKCINMILDHARVRMTAEPITDAKITYEAITSRYKRNITFEKEYDSVTQLELIAYAGHKLQWLKKKLPETEITIMNQARRPLNEYYDMVNKFTTHALSKDSQAKPFTF